MKLQQLSHWARKPWLHGLLLILTGFAVRVPALSGELIWDDHYLTRDSPFIKSPLLILEAFRHHLFPDSFSGHYRPVQNVSFIVDYFFWNTDTYGFHLTNVLLHVASGVLLYCLLRKLLPTLCRKGTDDSPSGASAAKRGVVVTSFLVALLWVVHPVHSAAIDYISGRADSLAFLFACGGWLLFIAARNRSRTIERRLLYSCAALAAFLALGSREIACVWIVLFLLYLFLFERDLAARAKVAISLCCFAVLLGYTAVRQLPEQRSGAGPSSNWSGSIRSMLMLRALGDYGRLMIFPANLHMERTVLRPNNYRSNDTWRASASAEYLSIGGLFVLAGLAAGCVRRGAGQPMRIFGASWFLLGFLPISNIVELNATVAEHWLYLPSVGFLLFLAGCALDFPVLLRKGAVAFACMAVIGLSVRSAIRSSDWVTPETFFQRTAAAGGTSTRGSVNLAQIYTTGGEFAKAEAIYRNVLEAMPGYPIAQNNLANVLHRQGKTEEAEAILTSSNEASAKNRRIYPKTWIAALQLARLRNFENDPAAALAILEKARAEYPRIWELVSFQLEVVRQTQGPDAALDLLDHFIHDNWWHYAAALARGRLLAEKGEIESAEAALRFASWLDVHETEALNLVTRMQVRQGRLEEAIHSQRRAVARQPHQPRQYLLLSDILEKMGREAEARDALEEVSALQAIANSQAAAN